MRKIKILVSVLISMALLLSLFVPAMAASYTITVNGKAGETYTVYKIFNVYASGDNGVYTADTDIVELLNGEVTGLEFGLKHSDGKQVVTMNTTANPNVAKDLAKFLKANITQIPSAYMVDSETIADGATTTTLTVDEAGYYFVDTTMGTLCRLDTVTSDITVTEKNDEVSVDKVIVESSDVKENTVQIGDTVNFKTTISIPEGATNVVLYDKMEAGFTFDTTSVVVTGPPSGKYTLDTTSTSAYTFKITFSSDYLDSITATTEVTVTYSATLNENAEIASSNTNDNSTWATYGAGQETSEVITKTKTYDFNLFKYTGTDTALAGATFELYSDSACTTEISLIKIDGTHYRIAKPGETGTTTNIVSVDSAINIKGLDGDKTYYLKETAAPAGYNMVNTVYEVKSGASGADEVAFGGELKVQNNAGTLLPTTGGTGTKILFTVGGVLVVVAFVLFTSKRRMSAEG